MHMLASYIHMGKLQDITAYYGYKEVGRVEVSFQFRDTLNVSSLGGLEGKRCL